MCYRSRHLERTLRYFHQLSRWLYHRGYNLKLIIEIWTTSCAHACRQNINIAAEKNTLLKKIGKRKGKTYENTSITILVKDKYKENNTFKYFIECFHDLLNISDNLLFCAPCNACCSCLWMFLFLSQNIFEEEVDIRLKCLQSHVKFDTITLKAIAFSFFNR